MNERWPGLRAESAGHVLVDNGRNVRSSTKSPNGLEYLQLHQQCHLGRQCAGDRARPLPLVVTGTEEAMQIL
jgi:hypothetical protein